MDGMKYSRRLLMISGGTVLVLFLAAGILLRVTGTKPDEEAPAELAFGVDVAAGDAFSTDMPIPVEGAAVIEDTLVLAVRAAGEAAAWRRTVVRAQVGGLVRAVPVRENTRLGAGALLVVLDPEEHQLALDEAKARLTENEARLREMTLFDARIDDEQLRRERQEWSRARSGIEAAEVAVRRAEINLRRTRVTAPFAGTIANLAVVPGQNINPNDELLTIQEIDPIRVEVQVLESEIGYLGAGRSAAVTFAAFPGRVFDGRIESINPIVEQQTRTARVTVAVRNPAGEILPGMYATVALDARRLPDRVMVPREAILERDRRTMLFVYDGNEESGLAKWRYVTTGAQNATHVEIVEHPDTDMVRAGEVVLIDGHYTLTHDARVRLTSNVAAEGGRPR
jgi:membrane fusion protein, multidrug efflux system